MSRTGVVVCVTLFLTAASLPAQTRDPRLVKHVEAECTSEARAKNVRGTVSLTMELDNEGTPVKVEALTGWSRGIFYQALGYGLEEAAIEALSQWRFKPSASEAPAGTLQLDVGFRCLKPLKAVWPRPE